MRLHKFAVLLLVAAVAAAGCGGGVSVEPKVTLKPGKKGNAGGNGDSKAAAITQTGTLVGTVIYQGTWTPLSPKMAKGKATKDPNICAHEKAIVDDSMIVGENGGIANVLVYLTDVPAGARELVPEIPADPAMFNQVNCTFIPHVLVVRTNQVVIVTSSDKVLHNTNSQPILSRKFNRGINFENKVELKYNRAETTPVPVKCDIHPWMNAYHLALDHPWGTATSSEQGHEGEFRIENVPVGEWKFRVWHEKTGGIGGFLEKALTVKIEADKTTTIDQEYPASRFQR